MLVQQKRFGMNVALAALQAKFGHKCFRGGQAEVIQAVLRRQDVLAVMPTGRGKSLCYQLPAVLFQGTTVVVSPLVALMEDQYAVLQGRGIPVARIHSRLPQDELKEEIDRLEEAPPKLLYVTPERLHMKTFIAVLKDVPIAQLVVDEAHCVFEWGHNFRPAYLAIGDVRKQIGNPPIIAVTATAPVTVRDDIVRILGLENAFRFEADVDRPEIDFQVQTFPGRYAKLDWLIAQLKRTDVKTIVYCSRTRSVDFVHDRLKGTNVNVARYHGQMDAGDRRMHSERFYAGQASVMVATEAFGMGIDVPDVRLAIHFELPDSLEQLMQEAGRAGRDGNAATHILAYDPEDARFRTRVISSSPAASWLWTIFDNLRKFARSPAERRAGATIYFDRQRFVGANKLHFDEQEVRRKSTALASLEAWGLLSAGPRHITFMTEPDEVTPETFPITENAIQLEREAERRRLGVLLYYINAPSEQRRSILLGHLRHNDVVGKLTDVELEDQILVPTEMIEGLLRVFVREDLTSYQLRIALLGERKPTPVNKMVVSQPPSQQKPKSIKGKKAVPEKDPGGKTKTAATKRAAQTKDEEQTTQEPRVFHPTTKALTTMEERELNFLVDRVEALGLIRRVAVGKRTFLSITELGLTWLRDRGMLESFTVTHQIMCKALFNPLIRDAAVRLLMPWFDQWMDGNAPHSLNALAERFLAEQFDNGTGRFTGRQLVTHYLDKRSKAAHKSEVISIIGYYLGQTSK